MFYAAIFVVFLLYNATKKVLFVDVDFLCNVTYKTITLCKQYVIQSNFITKTQSFKHVPKI